jgi:hypothetical protein
MPHIADRALYTDESRTKVLEHNHPDAAFLLVGEGGELTGDLADRHGIEAEKGRLTYPGMPKGAGPVVDEHDLSSLHTAKLRELAIARGVPHEPDATKAELIAALEKEPQAGAPESLEGLTKPKLLEMATARGLPVDTGATKAEIIAALEKAGPRE